MEGYFSVKLNMSLIIGFFYCFALINGQILEKKYDEAEGVQYLKKINADIQEKTTESVLASWAYESNITDTNLMHQLDVSAKLANYTKKIWKETIKYPWKTFKNPDVKRQFQKYSVLGTAILSPAKYEKFNKIISDMQSTYGKAKVCNYYNRTDCNMQLEPELTEIFAKCRNPDEVQYYWEKWRDVAGKPVRSLFKEYVDLSNEAAVLNNFTNNAEFWLKDYEAPDFKEQVESLWQQLRPLYLQLHAYVRRRLREQYGEKYVTKRGPIPAHLLGNMWAQSWGNIFDFTAPYPGKPSMDVTPNMVEQGYTPLRMFKLAEEFFTSLNLDPMPETFWKNSILEKPTDGRDLICHASAWDFYDGKDFRIKQCTRITMEDLNTVHHEMGHVQYFLQYKNQPLVYKEGTNPGRMIDPTRWIKQCTRVTFRQLVTVHHEMGHIQYYLQYKNQPKIYRRGANPGFHEAVGDVMALSVSTPKHLRKIGLLNATEDDAESEINQLFNMALDKIAFVPFGYLMDQWRWSVFEGKTTPKDYNCKWWQLREKYQGLSPSVTRTENDFDPGAKYHTVGNVPYIRYFVSFVIQFQFHRSLCIAAKEFDPEDPLSKPLHKCDIYQSKEAGALLKKMLQMGSSKPWPDAMEVITGQRKMDARALLDYFSTLQVWLENENKRTGEFIGWETSQRECQDEGLEVENPQDTKGNFEDDNIAYSYAEFVRQDDNYFGFTDYMEEVQPSHHDSQHRLKKKEFHNSWFLPKRKHLKSEKPFRNQHSYFPNRKKYIDAKRTRRQNYNFKYNYYDDVNDNSERQYKNNKIQKHFVASRNKRQKFWKNIGPKKLQKESELMDVIFKEMHPIRNKKDTTQRNMWDRNAKGNTEGNATEENEYEDVPDTKNTEETSRQELPEENQTQQPEAESLVMNEFEKIEYKNKPDSSISPLKKYLLNQAEVQTPNDLIWKAELVKNEAEKMLKSYNLSYDVPQLFNYEKFRLKAIQSLNAKSAHKSGISNLKKARSTHSHHNAPKCHERGKLAKFLKTDSEILFEKNPQTTNVSHFQEYDLVSILPLDSLTGNEDDLENKNEFPYVMLIGKLSKEAIPKIHNKKRKKSYKEYRYNVTTPVVYNAVIITPGGNNEKPDDTKDHWSKINKRMPCSSVADFKICTELRGKTQFTNNKYSVNDNYFNINNIVPYFGFLELLFWLSPNRGRVGSVDKKILTHSNRLFM